MKESGILDGYIKSFKPPPQFCPNYSGKPLGFPSVIFIFLVMSAGLISSFVLLVIEAFFKAYSTPDSTKLQHKKAAKHPINTPEENHGQLNIPELDGVVLPPETQIIKVYGQKGLFIPLKN